jgi:acetylglutamate kinase|tara:strand:- start:643 stop:1530 length:888 start_codon:yes stop_codon:yes gene_type:complete
MSLQNKQPESKQLLAKYWATGKKFHAKTSSFIKKYNNKIIVIKYGGYALTKPALLKSFAKNISLLNQLGIKVIVVHGGGPQIEKELKKRKINNEEYQGLRVTTKSVLGVVKRILSHDLNKLISDEIKKNGGKTKRLNGVSTKVLKAKIAMNGNIGFVGEPRGIDKNIIMKALKSNHIPIIAPLGVDANNNTLNVNADTAAAYIAESLKAERLLLLTDVAGVLDNNKKLITELDRKKAFQYIKKGTIKSGMIPKIKACFNTLKNGAKGVALIDGRKQNAVAMELLTTQGAGTLIKK